MTCGHGHSLIWGRGELSPQQTPCHCHLSTPSEECLPHWALSVGQAGVGEGELYFIQAKLRGVHRAISTPAFIRERRGLKGRCYQFPTKSLLLNSGPSNLHTTTPTPQTAIHFALILSGA